MKKVIHVAPHHVKMMHEALEKSGVELVSISKEELNEKVKEIESEFKLKEHSKSLTHSLPQLKSKYHK